MELDALRQIRHFYREACRAWVKKDYKETVSLLRQAQVRTQAFTLYLEKQYLKGEG